ncbi:isochorismatase family protein [Virgibacillus dakarensis]|uniref:Isochorismatase family protein YaaI n=1 Tax=Lentibacillus populi TaxID=1827502 RepID=A0A9W5TZ28_9BACI|nr:MULTISPECIES: isochorismatase family cysteine hydrolase [Bacillaceae]MBT2215806.1 cysteine hydrolase [Virgibacillus dakarensis]MTW86485.1 isochorismatase family protein [Virgibacillus dakarensis]GGB50883.1 putative isochorismatase family protein YaaI [Lentibacillus populi]
MNISMENSAVLFIDLINDFKFEGGERLLHHTKEILPNLKRLKSFAKENNLPVIYINDHYNLWQADFHKVVEYCRNDASREVIDAMKPAPDDYFFIKPKHSAFFQTPLQSLLTHLKKTNLIMSGIAGDICILFSAKDAYMYEYSLHVPENCMASNEKQGNEYALYLMRTVMDANTEPI